jgi:restriction system protein
VETIVDGLSFIENKLSWGSYFQGGIRGISENDFHIIEGNIAPNLVEQIKSATDIENQAEFALERHLEDFIVANWKSIDFHADLDLYETDGLNGQQFPAGPAGQWNIDFLCVDKKTNDFVVVELKRGRSSDAVVGQVLRYMAWVRDNLVADGQGVRAVVIAHSADDALRYAVKALPNVDVLTYRLSFALSALV